MSIIGVADFRCRFCSAMCDICPPRGIQGACINCERPLFVPLMRQYFEAFKRGEKVDEFRAYGIRWNEKTCRVGRLIVLSLGYGKGDRLMGYIQQAKITPASQDFLKIYGPDKQCFAIRPEGLHAV